MSTHDDLPSWLDGTDLREDGPSDDALSAELKAGIREARGQGPGPEERMRLRAALGLPPAPGRSTTPDAGREADPNPTPAAGKPIGRHAWWATALATLGAATVWWATHTTTPEAPPPDAGQPHETAGPAGEPPAPPPANPRRKEAPAARTKRELEPEPEPKPAAKPRAPEHRKATPPQPTQPEPPAERQPQPTARSRPTAADPMSELRLLRQARVRARSAPEQALDLVAEHEKNFPNGSFVQEREVIAIDALLAAGERQAAASRAQQFFDRYPNSAHSRRVRKLLSVEKDSVGRRDQHEHSPP